jgi:hypothetical protein
MMPHLGSRNKMGNWAKKFVTQSQGEDKRTGAIGQAGFGKRSIDGIQSSKNAAIAVPPRGTPQPQNYTEKYSLQQKILNWSPTSSNAAPADNTVHAFVYTPSNRLIVTVQAILEPDTIVAVDPVFSVGGAPSWNFRRMIINSKSGRETPASLFYPGTSGSVDIPDEAIIPDAPELMRINFNEFATTQFGVPYNTIGVNLILQVKWEPDVQTIPFDELQRLYQRCRINYGTPLEIQNAIIP